MITRILGLDLGQAHDPAALAIVDKQDAELSEFIGPPDPNFKPRIHARALRQWKLGTDYGDVIEYALSVPAQVIVVDFGGVGRPVVDEMRRTAMRLGYKGKIRPVQLIASSARAQRVQEARGTHWNVPKIDVMTSLIVAQQKGTLRLADNQDSRLLLQQMRDFQMRVTKAANVQLGNRPGRGKHDDVVVALALAVWYAQRFASTKLAIYC